METINFCYRKKAARELVADKTFSPPEDHLKSIMVLWVLIKVC